METQKFYEHGFIINMVAMATMTWFLNKMSPDIEDRMFYYALLIYKKY